MKLDYVGVRSELTVSFESSNIHVEIKSTLLNSGST